ncbi:hypothetical protein ACVR1G_01530 [Streptococcus dentasini]
MTRRRMMIILLTLVLLSLFGSMIVVVQTQQAKTQPSNSTSSSSATYKKDYEKDIKLDQVYEYEAHDAKNIIVFKSNNTYIYIQDRATIYKTQADLNEAGNEEEMAVTPVITYGTGTYEFVGNNIKYTSEKTISIGFSTVANVKARKYFSKENETFHSKVIWTKEKKGYSVNYRDIRKLYKSDYSIPNTEEEFLERYTYDPSTKDDR